MSHLCLPDLRRTRARVFFWLGLLILPVFWIWWMNKRWFNRTERVIGWSWTAIYAVTAIHFLPEFSAYTATYLSIHYPILAMWMAIGLGLWLVGRKTSVGEAVVLFFVFGPHLVRFAENTMVAILMISDLLIGTFLGIWLLPLAVAAIHLLGTPDWGGLRKCRL